VLKFFVLGLLAVLGALTWARDWALADPDRFTP
jgi:hypothetical protein